MALADLDDLARVDEQALDLGRLIGAPHPPFEAARRRPGGQIAGREAQQRIVVHKPRYDDFADLVGSGRFVGPRSHDLDNKIVVDQHAGHKRAIDAVGLVGDDSEVGGGVGLTRLDAGALKFGA